MGDHRRHHCGCSGLVVDDRVVERTVWLHVPHRGPLHCGEAFECPQLVQHHVDQFERVDVDEPTAEAGEVGIAHLGPDRDTEFDSEMAGPTHDHGIAAVETTRHVRRRDHLQQASVVADRPTAEPLTEIGVEIDRTARARGKSAFEQACDHVVAEAAEAPATVGSREHGHLEIGARERAIGTAQGLGGRLHGTAEGECIEVE